eukprot:s3537_g4.t1
MGSSLASSAYHWSHEEGTWAWNWGGQTWLWQERHCEISRLGDSCNCDCCGFGWWAESGVLWKGVVPPTWEEWEEEWRKWEEDWRREERAQTLVLLAQKLPQLPLKKVLQDLDTRCTNVEATAKAWPWLFFLLILLGLPTCTHAHPLVVAADVLLPCLPMAMLVALMAPDRGRSRSPRMALQRHLSPSDSDSDDDGDEAVDTSSNSSNTPERAPLSDTSGSNQVMMDAEIYENIIESFEDSYSEASEVRHVDASDLSNWYTSLVHMDRADLLRSSRVVVRVAYFLDLPQHDRQWCRRPGLPIQVKPNPCASQGWCLYGWILHPLDRERCYLEMRRRQHLIGLPLLGDRFGLPAAVLRNMAAMLVEGPRGKFVNAAGR